MQRHSKLKILVWSACVYLHMYESPIGSSKQDLFFSLFCEHLPNYSDLIQNKKNLKYTLGFSHIFTWINLVILKQF